MAPPTPAKGVEIRRPEKPVEEKKRGPGSKSGTVEEGVSRLPKEPINVSAGKSEYILKGPKAKNVEGIISDSHRQVSPTYRILGPSLETKGKKARHFFTEKENSKEGLSDRKEPPTDGKKPSTEGISKQSPQIGEILSNSQEGYASDLHNGWRAARDEVPGEKAVDGLPKREPRPKEVDPQDPALRDIPDAYRNGNVVDIANLDFSLLPAKFKYENLESAKGVMEILTAAINGNPGAQKITIDLEAASSTVHDQWLSRNGSWAPPGTKETLLRIE